MPHHDLHGITKTLQASGERVTASRLAVLEYLCTCRTPMSVKDLEHALPQINIVTLYRILEYCIGRGIVKRLIHDRKEQLFELADPYHRHHHHRLCESCGQVQDVNCQLKLPTLKDFVPTRHVVTIYGFCRDCLAARRKDLPQRQRHVRHNRKKQ